MAKQSGLGDRLFIDGNDVSGDIGSLSKIGGGPAALEVTGIDKSAFERLGGLRDGGIAFNAWFNPDRAHLILADLPNADAVVTYLRGSGLGRPGACLVGKQLNYDGTRGDDGAFTFTVEAAANGYGLEWGDQVSDGLQVDTAAGNGESVDLAASASHGLQAYLHVTELTGTNVVVKLQDSPDDSAWSDVTGGEFASVTTAPAAARIATASGLSVARYLRVVTSGVFTSASFVLVVARNETAVSF